VTREATVYVRLPSRSVVEFLSLDSTAKSALRRHRKSDPGELNDLRSFEAIQTLMEQKALALVNRGEHQAMFLDKNPGSFWAQSCLVCPEVGGAPELGELPVEVQSWIEEGASFVFVNLPHEAGQTLKVEAGSMRPPEPLKAWRSPHSSARRASGDRLEFQLEQILADPANASLKLNPSGVPNRPLTDTLRMYAAASPGQNLVYAQVEYRDGSTGPDFPLRSVSMSNIIPSGIEHFRFSLLSVRHVELDRVVDGAWFRNSQISVGSRKVGVTDQLAYQISMEQLDKLAAEGPLLIELYQTGLEPAIMGFYRALVQLMRERPGTISVLPMYFTGQAFAAGKVWSCA
jgi:hypothetical protein